MSTTILIFVALFTHFVADFLFQTDKMSKNKSKDFGVLVQHTLIYSAVWFIVAEIFYYDVLAAFFFAWVMLLTHTLIDFITSKITTRLWEKGKVKWFFTTIGFDQVLHYLTIYFAFKFIV